MEISMMAMRRLIHSWRIKRIFLLPWLLQRRIRNGNDLVRFSQIRAAKVVTFDVFDTSLLRSVAQPVDALALASYRAAQRLASGIGMQALLEARLNAEIQARRLARAEGREEVTLDGIYARLPGPLSEAGAVLRMEELGTERDVCCANPVILAIYWEILESGVPVAFISDTCLPETFLESLLAEKGYTGRHRVFASSTFGMSKLCGGLYPLVASRLGVRPKDIWHIGDNAHSDVAQAHRTGINGLWFRPKLRRLSHLSPEKSARDEGGIAKSLIAGIPESLAAESNADEPPWKTIGLTVAGPLYLGFTQWLIKRLTEFAPDRVYFFARDGHIVNQVYDVIRNQYPRAPAAKYLMVSRRSLVFPTLERLDPLALRMLCGGSLWMPANVFLTRIGLNPRNCRRAMLEHDLSPDTLIDGDQTRGRLRSLFLSLEPEILAIARQERILLVSYLRQEGCLETERLALCDVGWKGSLQLSLSSILKSERPGAEVSGFYLGTEQDVRQLANSGGVAAGWLIDTDLPEKRRRIIQSGRNIVELFFTASHGSVRGYCEKQGRINPVLEEMGIESEYVHAAEQIQAAALKFVDRYAKAFGGLRPIDLDRNDVFPALARLIDRPTLVEANALGNLTQVDGLGNARLGQPIARPPSFWQAVAKPSAVIAKFRQSPWRLGFLVRFIGIPQVASFAMAVRRLLEFRSRAA
jgi:predicted HAD superfamily hydrolase